MQSLRRPEEGQGLRKTTHWLQGREQCAIETSSGVSLTLLFGQEEMGALLQADLDLLLPWLSVGRPDSRRKCLTPQALQRVLGPGSQISIVLSQACS